MIRISDSAQAHFAKLLANQEEGTQIRVFVINPGTRMQNAVSLIAHRTRWKHRHCPEI
jgi:Fe-S cluster assembly iron-binding protein IscA